MAITVLGKEASTQAKFWEILGQEIRKIADLPLEELKNELKYSRDDEQNLLERILFRINDSYEPYGMKAIFNFLEVFPYLFSQYFYPEDGNTTMENTFSHLYRELVFDHFTCDSFFNDLKVDFDDK
jgi:hypothetical protein